MPIYINIGYTDRGVNFLSIIFAPSYDNSDSDKEYDLTIGKVSAGMDFENLAFSQKNAFIGFTGSTSPYGLSINKLGVVTFTCAYSE